MKTYYSAQEVEDLAARGIRQLVLDDEAVLTDLARELAQRLGIALIYPGQTGVAVAPGSAPTRASIPLAAPRQAARPAGCQHGPLAPAQSQSQPPPQTQPRTATSTATATGTVVDQMVGLVKQLAGKR
jgi:hypothetical protein